MTRIFSWILVVATCVALAQPIGAHGQSKTADPGKILGQTPETGALPYWSQPSAEARKNLGQSARNSEAGVFLVGHPKFGHGTAWVISKKHRLLVTNAHVADILHRSEGKMVAIPSGTAQIYVVEKVWYHPGVRRYLEGNRSLSVRSVDPKEGKVDPRSPDLAVLQLSSEGPELNVEFPVATADEVASLFAQSVAMIGFPGHDTTWPQLGEKAASTFHDGVVSRVTDFDLKANSNPGELQFLQYTMSDWGGFSGSPVILPTGRVAAVHNMARTYKDEQTGETKVIPHGIRVDCVVELLVHHGLDDKVAFKIDKTKVAVERWTRPDARSEKARTDFAKADELVGEARYQIFVRLKFKEGIEKCEQAIELVPNFAPAYQARSYGYNNYFAFIQNDITTASKLKLLRQALADAQKYGQIAPSDPAGAILSCSILINIGIVKDDDTDVRNGLEVLSKLLTNESLPNNMRAQAHSYRAGAYNFNLIGDKKAALREHNEALRLEPRIPVLWENRALYWQENGRDDFAEADRAKARELRAASIERGMKIVQTLDDGVAKKAGLRPGDVIVSVGGTRVQSLNELMAALAKATGPVDVELIRSRNMEKLSITPVSGKIGVAVEQVELD